MTNIDDIISFQNIRRTKMIMSAVFRDVIKTLSGNTLKSLNITSELN